MFKKLKIHNFTETIGVSVILGGLATLLLARYSIMAWSDPAHWYSFGMSFWSQFDNSHLAYGFPLILALAKTLVGPFYAFLVNIPILIILLLVFYLFARKLESSGSPHMPAFVAGLSVLFVIFLNRDMFLYLANPYRDPSAFLFMLVGFFAVICLVRRPSHSWGWMIAAGLSMAFAISCRETTALALPAVGLYLIAAKYRHRSMPFWLPVIVFGLFLFLGMIPWMVQNQMVSGNIAVPSQAVRKVSREGYLQGLLPNGHVLAMIHPTLMYLLNHYGIMLSLLFFGGVIIAATKKNLEVFWLCLPSIVIFFAFYCHYHKVVPRYLLVMDWFAIPVMGYGLAIIINELLSIKFLLKMRNIVFVLALPMIYLATLAIMFWPQQSRSRFLLEDAKRLQSDLNATLPENANILCERPLTGILVCFSHTKPQTLKYLSGYRELRDPVILDRIDRLLAETDGEIYVAFRSKDFYGYLRRVYQVEERKPFSSMRYNLEDKLASTTFNFGTVRKWTNHVVQTEIALPAESNSKDAILCVDVGLLSRYPRSHTKITCDGELLTESPVDNRNYFVLDSAVQDDQIVVKMESDGPVPESLRAEIIPADQPIRMSFKQNDIIPHLNRFSDSFVDCPGDKYPNIVREGSINAPTPPMEQGILVFCAKLGFSSLKKNCTLQVSTQEKTLFTKEIEPGKGLGDGSWNNIGFQLPAELATSNDTRIAWRLIPPRHDEAQGKMLLRCMEIYRVQPNNHFELCFGQEGDQFAIVSGLHRAERVPGSQKRHWRWTNGEAKVNLFLEDKDEPAKIIVGYFDEGRPQDISAPRPVFKLNGHRIEGPVTSNNVEGMQYKEVALHIRPELFKSTRNILTIESNTWVPSEHEASEDSRELGLMLNRIEVVGKDE